MYVVYSTKVTGSKTGPNANRDVRTLYMVGVIKERERERERRGWIGRIAEKMWIHEMC